MNTDIDIKRHGGLGDVVMALSIAKALHNRGYKIGFSTGPSLLSIVKYQKYIDCVFTDDIKNGINFPKEFSFNTQSKIEIIHADLECLNCQLHGGCKIDNNEQFNALWDFLCIQNVVM